MKRTVSLVVAALLLASGVISTANAYVAVSVGVGDRPYYVHGPAYYVGPVRYVWIPGHHAWRYHHRVWVHGYYAAR
ncbi:MAG: hypothetical protein QOG67_3272 [Verrucomicrobiota bacterium]|jgi:hypothetical protein